MQRQRFTHDRAFAGDDVQHAVRQSGLKAKLCQPQGRQRRDLWRLHHHRIAHSQRRRDFPRADHQREVPRDDRADHAHRLAVDKAQRAGCGRGDVAVYLVDHLRVVAEGARCAARFGAQGHADLGTVVAHAKDGQLQHVFFDQVGDAVHDLFAGGWRHLGPAAIVVGGARSRDRCVHVLVRAKGEGAEGGAINGGGVGRLSAI